MHVHPCAGCMCGAGTQRRERSPRSTRLSVIVLPMRSNMDAKKMGSEKKRSRACIRARAGEHPRRERVWACAIWTCACACDGALRVMAPI